MDMNRDQAVLSGAKLWLIVGIAAGVAVVSYFMAGSSPDEPKPAQPVETPAIESELPALPESESETETETEPLVLPPAPEPEAPKRQPEVVVKLPPEKPPEPVVPGLPLLEGSDPEVYRELAGTVRNADAADLKGVIAPKDRIRRFVTTVKNVGEHKIARRHLPVRAAKGAFAVKRIPDGRLVIDKANYRRYTPYVELLEAVDAQKLAAVYKRLSPLFDQAYQELGYPRGKFERPLLARSTMSWPRRTVAANSSSSASRSITCSPTKPWSLCPRSTSSCCAWVRTTLAGSRRACVSCAQN